VNLERALTLSFLLGADLHASAHSSGGRKEDLADSGGIRGTKEFLVLPPPFSDSVNKIALII
jgi:hypothetical protein